MLNHINGKSNRAERAAWVAEAKRMVAAYGWEHRTTMPWPGVEMSVLRIINDVILIDEEPMTKGSVIEILSLAEGLTDIMNAWEQHERVGKVAIRVLATGRIARVDEDLAKWAVDAGLAVRVTITPQCAYGEQI